MMTIRTLIFLSLLIGGCLASMGVGIWRDLPPPTANDDSCAIYVSLRLSEFSEDTDQFRPVTRVFDYRPINELLYLDTFHRETGRVLMGERNGNLLESRLYEAFTFNTLPFLARVLDGETRSIVDCFTQRERPNFTRQSDNVNRSDQLLHKSEPSGIVTFSPIGFSESGRHAIVYAELSGEFGSFYLFEKTRTGWSLLGFHGAWNT